MSAQPSHPSVDTITDFDISESNALALADQLHADKTG